jgi:hypothetical protein
MGVERSVTRWYIQQQAIYNEIAQLEAQLAPPLLSASGAETALSSPGVGPRCRGQEERDVSRLPTLDISDLHQQLAKARQKLHLLGPCPRPMMG